MNFKAEIKKHLGRYPVPGWMYLIFTTAYNEVLLHLWTTEALQPGRFLAVIAFGLGFGCILALVSSLLPSLRAAKWTAVVLGTLVTVIWLVEYFISDAYQVFMTPATVFNGAGGVAGDFLNLVISLVIRGMWRILLALLPTFLYALLCRGVSTGWKLRGTLAAAAAGMYLLGWCSVKFLTSDQSRFGAAYEFDSAVRCFGLHMALNLETANAVSGGQEAEFVAMPTQPVQIPTQPEDSQDQTESETEPAQVAYEDNVIAQLDLDALLETYKSNANISQLLNYVNSLTPSKQNEYTGLFEGKNLILITAEAFAAQAIDPERTPTLYRMANEGIRFTEYYQPAWGGSTTSGEFSNLVGLVPTNGGVCMKEAIQQNLFLTMGNQLQRLDYYSAAYHNHANNFYDRNKTHTHLGYDRFIAQYGGLEGVKLVWPESDWEMMVATLPDYIDQQPFSIYYMTVSGHCVYSQEENAMSKKNYDVVADMDCRETVKCYYASQQELENAMAYLVEQLELAGIADDTVIVISTDHYPYGLERSGAWKNNADYLAELLGVQSYDKFIRDNNALIIWSGCLEDMDLEIDTPVYSLDILPTLSNLFGLEYDSRLLIGRDVFSEEIPLVLWSDHSWATDLGRYDAQTGEFTPAEGAQVPEGYQEAIDAIVSNKIAFSRGVLNNDFYNCITEALGIER